MARTVKKKKELTIEEKLAEALLPVEEQPYKVPENWCWVSASNLALVISKGTTPRGGKAGYVDDGIRFLRVENFCEDGTLSHEGIMHISEEMHTGFLKRSILQEGDILVSIAGTLGKTAVVRSVDLPINTNQAVCFIRPKNKIVNSIFIKFAFDNPVIQNHLLSQTKVTSIPNLTLEIIGKCPVPLPPLPEQQRIVDRIESLFAKLDEAKEKAQAVVDGFEDRKAAILHKAFTGELTKEWRLSNSNATNTWTMELLHAVCHSIKAGGDKPTDFVKKKDSGHTIPVVANGIENEGIIGYTAEYKNVGNAVTVSGRGTIGYSICRDYPFYPVVRLLVLEPNQKIIPKFLKYAFDAFPEAGTGTSIPQLTVPMIKDKRIPCPSLIEQKQIIDILEMLLYKIVLAKEAAEQVISQIDTMKKSILARAFRGELGTNDPTDENAEELLKRTL